MVGLGIGRRCLKRAVRSLAALEGELIEEPGVHAGGWFRTHSARQHPIRRVPSNTKDPDPEAEGDQWRADDAACRKDTAVENPWLHRIRPQAAEVTHRTSRASGRTPVSIPTTTAKPVTMMPKNESPARSEKVMNILVSTQGWFPAERDRGGTSRGRQTKPDDWMALPTLRLRIPGRQAP